MADSFRVSSQMAAHGLCATCRCTDSREREKAAGEWRKGHARPSVTIREMNRPPSFLDGQSMSFALRDRNHAAQRERHRLAVKETLGGHFANCHTWWRMAFAPLASGLLAFAAVCASASGAKAMRGHL